jgi:hypothetical protein
MSRNARDLLKQWWQEQHRIARVPSGGVRQEFASHEDAVAAYRTQGGIDKTATADLAEKRMEVISQLHNWANPEATLDETLYSPGPGDPPTLPNNQVQAVWTEINSIATLQPDKSAIAWTNHLKALRIQQLAMTINTCRG